MAVFEGQISAQVTQGQKDALAAVLRGDRTHVVGTSEADVIRAALALGLPLLAGWSPGRRVQMYALMRRGLEPDVAQATAGH